MLKISFQDVAGGVKEAPASADRESLQLAHDGDYKETSDTEAEIIKQRWTSQDSEARLGALQG